MRHIVLLAFLQVEVQVGGSGGVHDEETQSPELDEGGLGNRVHRAAVMRWEDSTNYD